MNHDASVALLASIFEESDIDELVNALKATGGDAELAIERLIQAANPKKRTFESPATNSNTCSDQRALNPPKRTKSVTVNSWLRRPNLLSNQPLCPDSQGIIEEVLIPRSDGNLMRKSTRQTPMGSGLLRSINDVLGPPDSSKELRTPRSLPPLLLATAKDISACLPCCSLLYNILPKDLATRLYLNMVADSQGAGKDKIPWTKNRWWLNDREVESPHSTAFFVSKLQGDGDDCSVDYAESAQYWYAGKALEADAKPRYFLPEMEDARRLIEPIVNRLLRNDAEILEMAQRVTNPVERFSDEWNGDWRANVAASNSYRGSQESVGWHADQLTYLGPYPTIASLSLGTGRQFRLRAVRNLNDPLAPPPRTYSIFLPHNSLLIMHGSCQERYKHCIPKQNSIDVFKPLSSNESYLERINITFRFYRPDFRPSRVDQATPDESLGTPKCHCGIPTILRADQKGKASINSLKTKSFTGPSQGQSTDQQAQSDYKLLFFWQCQGNLQNQGKNCGFFRLLDMNREHRGPCLGAERAAQLSTPQVDSTSTT
ncbi:hypothetical protein DFH28DRAFT_982860 [Melampsora americana]|nr:hypothetical protein DFH28DRAFT_982860 [Melampsora americana]